MRLFIITGRSLHWTVLKLPCAAEVAEASFSQTDEAQDPGWVYCFIMLGTGSWDFGAGSWQFGAEAGLVVDQFGTAAAVQGTTSLWGGWGAP